MKLTMILIAAFALQGITGYAQMYQKDSPGMIKEKDSLIMESIILPAVKDAAQSQEEPDWSGISTSLTTQYDATYADRMVTKGKIYFYYQRDPEQFSAALVHFTDTYEDKSNLKLMNKNANYILSSSDDKDQLKEALAWSRITIDKEPANADYKATYSALQTKLQ